MLQSQRRAPDPFGHLASSSSSRNSIVAAELDVSTATCHVGGNRHAAKPPGLRHDMRFALVEARVQHAMLDAFLFEKFRQQLRFFNRNSADQDRLAAIICFLDRLGNRAEFVGGVLVELVVLVDPHDRDVGREFRRH